MNIDYIKLFLLLVSGIAWTIVYINSIQIGFKYKTYAIPFWALALNFSWEILHGIIGIFTLGIDIQVITNAIWALFDAVILYTFFKYGKKYFPKNLKSGWFYIYGVSVLVISFVVEIAFIREYGQALGGGYAAFIQNLIMSVLFIAMLIHRNGTEGQSLTIAVSKWIGTLAPTILYGAIGSNALGGPKPLMLWTGILIAIIDVVYILMFLKAKKSGNVEVLF